MKKDLAGYIAVLAAAVIAHYAIELYSSSLFGPPSATFLPWMASAVWYIVLGSLGWITLRSRRMVSRLGLLALIAVVPHVAFEITHGSDPAYPYIGLLFIVPDLLWLAIGAGITAAVTRRTSVQRPLS
jgi:hypothetical protein